MSVDSLGLFIVGLLAAFVSAFVCIRWLLRYVATHDFTAFAWYRIGFGLLILIVGYSGGLSWVEGRFAVFRAVRQRGGVG